MIRWSLVLMWDMMGPHLTPLPLVLRHKWCAHVFYRLFSSSAANPISMTGRGDKTFATSCGHFLHTSQFRNSVSQSDVRWTHFGKCSLLSFTQGMKYSCETVCLQSWPVCNLKSGHTWRISHMGTFAYYSSSSSALLTLRRSSSLFLVPEPQCGHWQVRCSSAEPTTVYEALLDSQPVHFAESIFQIAHTATGLPWWALIVTTTVTLRLALTLPLAVYSQNIRARVESLQPEVITLAKKAFIQRFAARAKNEKWSEKRAQHTFVGLVRHYSRELYIRDNCHPAKGSILFLVQLPMWIFLSLALRNMTGAFSERMFVNPASIVPELATGGAFWFPSLAAPDPTLILPVMVGVLNLANIEMHALHKGRVTRLQRYLNNFLRAVSLIMVPVAAYVPSAMSLYWTASACYGLGQNILLKVPTARQALGIRPSKSDSETPFQDMGEEFVERYVRWSESKAKEGLLEKLENDVDGGQRRNSQKKSDL